MKQLTILGLSNQTIRSYVAKVSQYFQSFDEFNKNNVLEFIYQLKKSEYTNGSINSYLKALKKYEYIYHDGDLKGVKYLPKNRSTVSVLGSDELRRFYHCKNPSVRDYGPIKGFHMWTVYFAVMMFTGARCGEVDRLTVSDIDFGRGVIQIDGRKTQSPRDIPMQSELHELLESYIKLLDRDKLFTGTSAQERGRQFRLRLKQLGMKRKGLTPYSLRHSFATRMIEADNISLFDVKALMGHADIKTTEQYYHRSAKRLKKAISKDPLSEKTKCEQIKLLKEYIDSYVSGIDCIEYNIISDNNSLSVRVKV